jgi:hypothetical protein
MHEITDKAMETHSKIHQYYGKWPFWRFIGMQEPASVLFSILNGYRHYVGHKKYKNIVRGSFPWKTSMVWYGYAALNVWFWSAIFHARDFPFTEKV